MVASHAKVSEGQVGVSMCSESVYVCVCDIENGFGGFSIGNGGYSGHGCESSDGYL